MNIIHRRNAEDAPRTGKRRGQEERKQIIFSHGFILMNTDVKSKKSETIEELKY